MYYSPRHYYIIVIPPQVNGMDIIATQQAVKYARKWAVDDNKGPLLLEFVTYRYGGHSSVTHALRPQKRVN